MIVLACDHGGYALKEKIKKYLIDNRYSVEDMGSYVFDENDNFPQMFKPACEKILEDSENSGIFICGSGVGACILANRYKKIYAANCHTVEEVKLARNHNNINVLCLGGRVINFGDATAMVKEFMRAYFIGDKYEERMDDCDKI